MEKSWILCRKYCWKHGYSSVMRWDSVIHLTFSTVFRHKIQDFSMMSWFSEKIWYTWKMRKSESDSKYFVKSLENEVLPVKINKNHRKLCKLFTVWFPKELVMYILSKFSTWWTPRLWSDVSPLLEICCRKYFLWVTTKMSIQNCIKIISGK